MIRVSDLAAIPALGRYGTDERVTSGEWGAIFRGYDPLLCRPVTIKVLASELMKGKPAQREQERFRRRARAAGQLCHPNIPTILDLGEDDGISFLVMEDIDGTPLDRLLKIAGPLVPQRALTILLQVLEALRYSYDNRVLHLHLKPSEVFVSEADHVKVVGFGVALVNASDPISIDEILPATLGRAPEQLTGAAVDNRTDLFAAGALLFEMLTGTRPFNGRTVAEILEQMEAGVPEDVSALHSKVSRPLRHVLETALSYDPAQRFPAAAAFSDALREAMPLADGSGFAMRFAKPQAERRDCDPQTAENRWNPELLRRLKADLAEYIGPVAAIAVRRAAQRARDLTSFCVALSAHIVDDNERDQFLARAYDLATAAPYRVGALRCDIRTIDMPRQRGSAVNPPDPGMLDMIEAKLAEHLGPIARMLVAQQLQNSRGLSDLCRGLADHISDAAQRVAFLNWAEFQERQS
jgi:eukaryotic-like serine/threonine-protein kinase